MGGGAYRNSPLRDADRQPRYSSNYIYCNIVDALLFVVMQRPLSLLFSITYNCYCLWRIKAVWGKFDWGIPDCTDLWIIKQTNQVSPSSGFLVPH